ncbi:hypothetical protein [Motiliproteus sp. MSK22-1]|uniref:hypothetical protein n=1 Tax=Motiliproteus sp. MSK22-1 TaxID=1897630 RepID=UPI000975A4D2|nr:hypothetical protein [Motiliproteus sp. MSK22-1]OMH37545.1 hypothetical protein BGP75_09215 [Motiliproteus sp. MSK22-1]
MPAVPPTSQSSRKDQDTFVHTGLSRLMVITRFSQMTADGAQLAHHFGIHGKPLDTYDLVRSVRYLKLKSRSVNVRFQQFEKIALPAITQDK